MRKATHIIIPVKAWEDKTISWAAKIAYAELVSQQGSQRPQDMAKTLGFEQSKLDKALEELCDKGLAQNANGFYSPRLKPGKIRKAPDIPDDLERWVLEKWAQYNPLLPQFERFTPSMRVHLAKLMSLHSLGKAELEKAFKAAASSDFLNGRLPDTNFKARLDWLLADSNQCFQKLMMGVYHRTPQEKEGYEEAYGIKEKEKERYQ